jgi:hypothetical protein
MGELWTDEMEAELASAGVLGTRPDWHPKPELRAGTHGTPWSQGGHREASSFSRASSRSCSRAGQREHTDQRDPAATWAFKSGDDPCLSLQDRAAAGNRDNAGTGVVILISLPVIQPADAFELQPALGHSGALRASGSA